MLQVGGLRCISSYIRPRFKSAYMLIVVSFESVFNAANRLKGSGDVNSPSPGSAEVIHTLTHALSQRGYYTSAKRENEKTGQSPQVCRERIVATTNFVISDTPPPVVYLGKWVMLPVTIAARVHTTTASLVFVAKP